MGGGEGGAKREWAGLLDGCVVKWTAKEQASVIANEVEGVRAATIKSIADDIAAELARPALAVETSGPSSTSPGRTSSSPFSAGQKITFLQRAVLCCTL